MKRVMVIGCPGSGKSRFSRLLHKSTGLPLVHLDMLNWNADRTEVGREVFDARLREAISGDEWIIDGNYGRTLEWRFERCDTVFFFDLPTDECLRGIEERRGKVRPDMPWVEKEEDAEFTDFVRNFAVTSRPKIISLIEKYSDREIMVFHSREETNEYLK